MNLVNSLAIAVIAFPVTVADTMMAYTLSSKLTSNQTFASIDLHTTFHRPVMQGDVEPGFKGWEGTHMYLLLYIKMLKSGKCRFIYLDHD